MLEIPDCSPRCWVAVGFSVKDRVLVLSSWDEWGVLVIERPEHSFSRTCSADWEICGVGSGNKEQRGMSNKHDMFVGKRVLLRRDISEHGTGGAYRFKRVEMMLALEFNRIVFYSNTPKRSCFCSTTTRWNVY